jgi:hypothetical protein
LAKTPSQKPPSTPDDFPQVEPAELFPTNNIRFVISETAKLIERVDSLTRAIEKADNKSERALDKHAAEMKERFTDLKSEVKENAIKLSEVKSSIDSFKGAMKVLGGFYALALVLVAAFLAWYLRPIPQTVQGAVQPRSNISAQPSDPAKNSN